MDILAYEYMLQGLVDYNERARKPHGNVIVPYPTQDTTFPFTTFEEIRNVANSAFNNCHERVASVGYRADVYAKAKGTVVDKKTVARQVAKVVDEYLTAIGLTRVSFNVSEMENEGAIYHIVMTYSGNLHENRRKLI